MHTSHFHFLLPNKYNVHALLFPSTCMCVHSHISAFQPHLLIQLDYNGSEKKDERMWNLRRWEWGGDGVKEQKQRES